MALFRKPQAVEGHQAKMDRLEQLAHVKQAEDRTAWWLDTDEGWAELTGTMIGGSLADVLNEQVRITSAKFSNRHPAFVGTEERMQLITEGMKRAALNGWMVVAVTPVLSGWRPNGWTVDAVALADVTHAEMDRLEPLTDQEWFGLHNRNGVTIYQQLLRPLNVSSAEVGKVDAATELMEVGRWLLLYGMALGRAHIRLQPPA